MNFLAPASVEIKKFRVREKIEARRWLVGANEVGEAAKSGMASVVGRLKLGISGRKIIKSRNGVINYK